MLLLRIAEEREWLDGFLSRYIDLYRHFHPDEKNIFSVWDQKSDARTRNEGLRLEGITLSV